MGERSKVYMTDLRCRPGVSLLNKLEKLMRTAGIGEINFERKLVAIKMHFGEPGNLAFLRPNYAKVVADVVKSLGGVPFLTDCNTLYPGRRKNALEHLDAAYENGFSPLSTGCQVIIGDGLRGNDDVEVPVEGAEYIQTAKIGKAIMEADVIISLSHFKGHEQTGFGGAIKNLGMGCGSRRGKMEQHAQGKPMVAPRRCVAGAPPSAPTAPSPLGRIARRPSTGTSAWAAAAVLRCATPTPSALATTRPWRSWAAAWRSTPRR